LYDDKALPAMKRGTRRTLIHVLDHILKLLHPIMPFITEEIWKRTVKVMGDASDSIMLSAYPLEDKSLINAAIEEELDWLKAVVQAIRTIRSEMSITPGKAIPLSVRYETPALDARIKKYESTLRSLAKLSVIHTLTPDMPIPVSASAVVGDLELLIPMADLIDKESELKRLDKEITKLDKDIAFIHGKLNNPHFTDKAPAEVILKEKEKLAQALQAKEKGLENQARIQAL